MSGKSKREIDKQALDESIIKWEAIVGEYEKGNRLRSYLRWENSGTLTSTGLAPKDCPLCQLYHKKECCIGCPLVEIGDSCIDKSGSTWDNYDNIRDLTTATAMLNKLKELRRAYD